VAARAIMTNHARDEGLRLRWDEPFTPSRRSDCAAGSKGLPPDGCGCFPSGVRVRPSGPILILDEANKLRGRRCKPCATSPTNAASRCSWSEPKFTSASS
jgi:hypothetical protein